MCVCVYIMHMPNAYAGRRVCHMSDPLELKFRMVVNHHVGPRQEQEVLLIAEHPFLQLSLKAVSLCRLAWPGPQYADQVVLGLTGICLPLSAGCASPHTGDT